MLWLKLGKLRTLIRTELLHLTTINVSNRPWQLPFTAALASGLPLLIGAYFNHLDYGLISSLGGLVFLYLPNTPLNHRMMLIMACSCGMSACYALGVLSHFFPLLMILVLTLIAISATMICRFYTLGPPGSLFFVMAASIGAYSPIEIMQIPMVVGLLTMGCLLACLLAFIYSIYVLRQQAPQPAAIWTPANFDFVVFDSIVIGLFVGIALILAHVENLQRAYWVPVSCLAVIQGVSLRAVWNRQLHRIAGTGIGLLLFWGLLALPMDKWAVVLLMTTLTFVIESLVVRHYGLAVIFVTPLTILLAEAANIGQGSTGALIQARLFDTALGCLVGLIGGACLHSSNFRDVASRHLRRMFASRLFP